MPGVLPDEGSITGNRYENRYFGFSYALPEGLEVDEDFMQGEEDQSKQAFLLLAAFGPVEGKDRLGVVISADRSAGPEIRTARDYLAKLSREHFQAAGFDVVKDAGEVTVAGHSFSRIDYRKEKTYETVLATQWRGYVLLFNLVGPTGTDTDRLFASLESLKFKPGPRTHPPQTVPSKSATRP